MAGADLRRNSYSVRYSHLVRPQHSVRVSLVSPWRIRRRSGLLGERVDRFRVGQNRCLGMPAMWRLERVQRRSCLPLSGSVGRQFGRHEQVALSAWL